MFAFDRATAIARGLVAAAVLLPSAALAQSVTISHAKGEATFDAVPQRVAVYDLASLDILDALGVAAVAGLPRGEDGSVNVPDYLAAYKAPEYAGIGTLFQPDIEALTALAPDLIIIAGRSAGQYDAVSGIAPTLDLSVGGEGLVADSIHTTRLLGQLFRVEERAEARIAELNAAVAQMHAAAPAGEKALFLFSVEKGSIAHAPGARFGTLYDYAGLPSVMDPVDPRADGPAPKPGTVEAEAARAKREASREAALEADPNWIFALDRAAISGPGPSMVAERLSQDSKVTATPAWQEGKLVYLDPCGWYLVGAGIQNLTLTAAQITALYQEKG